MPGGLPAIVAGVLGIPVDQVTNEVGPRTYGQWSSLKHIQLIAAVEDAYAVRFSPREIRSVRTVGGLRDLLALKGVPT